MDKQPIDGLKPCPFCGVQPVPWEYFGYGVVRVIECTNCHVRFLFKYDDNIAEHWNRREIENSVDKIQKVNIYLLRKYKSELLKEFSENVFDKIADIMTKEMPLPWYLYGFGEKD